jgi:TatD DNase family protein
MNPDLFDCHCHLQDPSLAGRVPELLERARAAGVRHCVCCATREADWDAVLGLADAQDGLLPMLGLHPWCVDQAQPGWLGRLRGLLARGRAGLSSQGRPGVGECGLDFSVGQPAREAQIRAFRAQLALAIELDLPLAIHAVRAWDALLELLRELGIPAAGALVHDYSGSAELARELQALGLHLSFSGSVLRPDARRGPRALAAVAPERLLLESDAPRWAHADAALLRAEPAGVTELLRGAAALRGETMAALAAQVTANAHALFRRMHP